MIARMAACCAPCRLHVSCY